MLRQTVDRISLDNSSFDDTCLTSRSACELGSEPSSRLGSSRVEPHRPYASSAAISSSSSAIALNTTSRESIRRTTVMRRDNSISGNVDPADDHEDAIVDLRELGVRQDFPLPKMVGSYSNSLRFRGGMPRTAIPSYTFRFISSLLLPRNTALALTKRSTSSRFRK